MSGMLPEGGQRGELRGTYVANVRHALHECENAGVTLRIEPISEGSLPGYYMNHALFALEILDELASPAAELLCDLYHVDVNGSDPAFLGEHLSRVAHAQIADNRGRHEPGTGGIDFAGAFRLLKREGYEGWIGLEHVPSANTCSSVGWIEKAQAASRRFHREREDRGSGRTGYPELRPSDNQTRVADG